MVLKESNVAARKIESLTVSDAQPSVLDQENYQPLKKSLARKK